MLSERQIKSRFRKSHLLKLANDLLSKDLDLKEGTKKWFVLRNGHTVEDLIECVAYKGMEEKVCRTDDLGRHWHTVNVICTSKQVNYRGVEITIDMKFELVCDDDCRKELRGRFNRPGWNESFRNAPYQEQLDKIIMWDLFRYCDHIIKDNSEIPIYI